MQTCAANHPDMRCEPPMKCYFHNLLHLYVLSNILWVKTEAAIITVYRKMMEIRYVRNIEARRLHQCHFWYDFFYITTPVLLVNSFHEAKNQQVTRPLVTVNRFVSIAKCFGFQTKTHCLAERCRLTFCLGATTL